MQKDRFGVAGRPCNQLTSQVFFCMRRTGGQPGITAAKREAAVERVSHAAGLRGSFDDFLAIIRTVGVIIRSASRSSRISRSQPDHPPSRGKRIMIYSQTISRGERPH